MDPHIYFKDSECKCKCRVYMYWKHRTIYENKTEMLQAMEMNDKPGGSGDMANGDEETPGGVPLPTPAQLNADMQSAHAAAAALDEKEEQAHGGKCQSFECTAARGLVLLPVYETTLLM